MTQIFSQILKIDRGYPDRPASSASNFQITFPSALSTDSTFSGRAE